MSAPECPLPDLSGVRIAVVNPYLEGREKDCERNLYPRSHLWGADALQKAGAQVVFIAPPKGSVLGKCLAKLSQWSKGRLGNLEQDWSLLRRFWRYDLIYICHGSLLMTQWLRALRIVRCPVVSWVYLPPQTYAFWKLRDLQQRFPFSNGMDGLLCLTSRAEDGWKRKWPQKTIRYLAWGADTIMFPGAMGGGEFFFACGRTNRDYATLITAAAKVPARFVILASRDLLENIPIPANVELVEGPQHAGTDRGIPYADVISNYYAKAMAVLICRMPIEDDTSGLTNLLEALAMGRPVAITRTGALDLDVEKEGAGCFVPPSDIEAWTDLLNRWVREPKELARMSSQALRLVRECYNHERHGRDVANFLSQFVEPSRPSN